MCVSIHIESKPKSAKPSKKKVGNVKHGSKPSGAVNPSSKTVSKQPPAPERDSLNGDITETVPAADVESSTPSLSAAATPTPGLTTSVAPVPEDSGTGCKMESTPSGEEGEGVEKRSRDGEVTEGQKDPTTTTTSTCTTPEAVH